MVSQPRVRFISRRVFKKSVEQPARFAGASRPRQITGGSTRKNRYSTTFDAFFNNLLVNFSTHLRVFCG